MSEKPVSSGEKVIFRGKLFEILHHEQPDGRTFEIARRAPGVRIIIADKQQSQLMLTKEYRSEFKDWDYRLPGGKVFDSTEEYERHRAANRNISAAVLEKVLEEARQEAGIEVASAEIYKKSVLGATVEWDLYVCEATKWSQADGQELEAGEQIETGNWFSYEQVKAMILLGEMQEERVAMVLLQWIYEQQNKKGK